MQPTTGSSSSTNPLSTRELTASELEAESYEFDAREVADGARELNILAALSIPDVMEFEFPPLFIYFWARCAGLVSGERGFPKLGLGIPRGFGKTIFLKLLIVFIVLFTKRKFVLVICASQTLAEALISDVIDILDSDNIRTLFGNWDDNANYNKAESKSFRFRGRNIIIKARGQGSSFRGVNEKFSRPDVMLFDDSQTKESAESPQQAKEYIEWFRGTAMKAKDPKFCCYLYLGNMYRKTEVKAADPQRKIPAIYGCHLKNLKNSKHWESIIVGGILANGESLWEDLQSRAQLLQEYQEDVEAGVEEVFLAEVMNDDEAFNSGYFDLMRVPDYPFTDATYPQGRFLMIDPSLGKAKSDDQMVGLIDVIDGRPCIKKLQRFQVSAPQLVQDLITWCLEENIPAIAIESYAYQASLGQWFEYYLEELDIEGIEILLIDRGATSKNSAILSMFKECMTGYKGEPALLLLHPDVRGILYNEIKAFDPMKKDNIDNSMDVVSYASRVMLEYPSEIQCHLLLANNMIPPPAPRDRGITQG